MSKIKFTWGTGIFLFIVLFVAVGLFFLWYTFTIHISMVEEDYYPKELRHEEQLNKIRNANALQHQILIVIDNELVTVTMPMEMQGKHLIGQIHVYRPSDETLDLILPLVPDTAGNQTIARSKLVKGKYIFKVDWALGNVKYYQEQEIFIP